MSIAIFSASASPKLAPNGKTTTLTITFVGEASQDNTKIIVKFTSSPNTPFSIDGQQSVEENYELNSTQKTFTKTLKIKNNLVATSSGMVIGRITLTAREIGGIGRSKSVATFKNQD